MILNIPTILTLLRIASIPIIMVIFYWPIEESRLWCSLIFIVASFTDWVDGFLARKLNLQTAFGAFLDPVADKLMVVIILVLIVQADPAIYIALPVAIIIGREVTVASLREWMAEIGQRSVVKVSRLGKYKTGFQMFSIVCLLFNADVYGIPVRGIGIAAIYVAAILTLWSMWHYIQLALPEFKK
ncbi:MAG: CDP-diacylglycerol--glycerol-3-phosphate 3-phosphatidyltransferase [Cycloclasticus sp.]|jgi:CDP-diacylglycerol--glycerol-3-phosphate 3-phosphatidyltransferase|nr:MAG: CDP-diacylglycerol--glycerol-3-phosphate 3-phosphatidyltransferase [Cycloclasticus sp. Phe_18]KXJ51241.1 MAG: CDP-diacylglycerol--glycerol-3-phosphate 3-phosphatidyltransferase [Colwellia sp. Phe_37]MBV1913509.1 CDP-diacylglycerol--glycerol-3-phosphate 3-phosphatidyltransferase [Cycloclasticus sp.]MDF1690100.1 CDP-diacylglycerol--glycerol-3-phosphate 3-phosphatidyltransferase [Cycloclasticus sp.]MEE4290444.1 CDP-diacylglycerol--glycerol-3-phosphate 3-phosphatidyltransferase [Cycloclasti